MATYVLVHGGSHGGWCYQRVARILRSSGHDVHCPTLTGLGERSHLLSADVDLDTHITDVVNVLVYEDLRNVILAGHSYGGMVITGVADRALDRVGQLVYLDAAIPVDGESLARDVSPTIMARAKSASRVIDGVELAVFPGHNDFGVTDPDDFAWMMERLTPQPWKSFEQPLRLQHEAAVKQIPTTAINCTPTLRLKPRESTESRVYEVDRVWEIDTGHDLMITEPVAVAEMLARLASV